MASVGRPPELRLEAPFCAFALESGKPVRRDRHVMGEETTPLAVSMEHFTPTVGATPQAPEPLSLLARLPDGSVVGGIGPLRRGTSVHTVKAAITARTGLAEAHQALFVGGRSLVDLPELGVSPVLQQGSIIDVCLRLHGGEDGDQADDGGDDGLGVEVTMYIFFGTIIFCVPVLRWVRHHYISRLEEKLSESFKRMSERVSDSRMRLSGAGRKVSGRMSDRKASDRKVSRAASDRMASAKIGV